MTIINVKECSVCKSRSVLDQGFITQKSLFKKGRLICVTCHNFLNDSNAQRELEIHLTSIGLGLIFIIPDIAANYGWFLINLSLFHLLSLLTTILHESGHALAAWLTGQKVVAISFGRGKTLFSKKLFGAYMDFNIIPVEGLMVYAPVPSRFLRTKIMIITFAGPLVNLLIAWLIWNRIDHHEFLPSFFNQAAILPILFISNLIAGCLNLIPFQFNSSVGKLWSDGGKIFTIPFWDKEQLDYYHQSGFHGHAFAAFQHNDHATAKAVSEAGLKISPDDRYLKNLLAIAMLEQGECKEARGIFKELLSDGTASDYEKGLFLNNVAYANYQIGDPKFMDEALECSEKAYELVPWELAVRGTRGAVMIENHQLEEGIKLLNDPRNTMSPNHTQASIKCILATAYAKQDKIDWANTTLQQARELDPDNEKLKWAEDLIQKESE